MKGLRYSERLWAAPRRILADCSDCLPSWILAELEVSGTMTMTMAMKPQAPTPTSRTIDQHETNTLIIPNRSASLRPAPHSRVATSKGSLCTRIGVICQRLTRARLDHLCCGYRSQSKLSQRSRYRACLTTDPSICQNRPIQSLRWTLIGEQ
jgi:hypothetical protein